MIRFSHCLVSMLSAGAMLIAAPPVLAGTLIEVHLSGIRAVDLRFLLGSLQNRPDFAVEVSSLEESLESLAAATLRDEGIEVSSTAQERLLLTVELENFSDSSDWQALLVSAELLERAALIRRWGKPKEEACWVTSWREFQVRAIKTSQNAHETEELVRTSVEEFADRVRAANAYTSKVQEQEADDKGKRALQFPRENQ